MAGWSGTPVRKARAYWRSQLTAAGALPCYRCRQPVTIDQRWTVEHIVQRSLGGDANDPTNQWVSHAKCNFSDGGRLGAAKTNARTDAPHITTRIETRPTPW